MLDPIHRLLLLNLHCVTQTQRTEKQLLVLLWWMINSVLPSHTHIQYAHAQTNSVAMLTLASGPGDVSIMSMLAAPGITCQQQRSVKCKYYYIYIFYLIITATLGANGIRVTTRNWVELKSKNIHFPDQINWTTCGGYNSFHPVTAVHKICELSVNEYSNKQ